MTLLEQHIFLNNLEKYFLKSRQGGPSAVRLTIKPYDGRTRPEPRSEEKKQKLGKKARKTQKRKRAEEPPKEDLCLVRAKVGSEHISTVLRAKEVNRFHIQYMGLLREHMNTLQKPAKEKKTARRVVAKAN
ncbi:unnamed protein product [Bursaphelenchus xylophilus]|uniref:Signal recognition particle 14 kDa protein n=1 Tax=Bursaphelenchus xylophilus TaxID=6326 RepID=A0A1I7RXQ5_BURXY|nr:unnamed protein product [Bursaphelenchus xylophilus]CAG9126655.1 unnamed protein product [Bursaphelenchus xylophilus]